MKNELFVTAREQRRSWEFSNHKWFFGLPVFQRISRATHFCGIIVKSYVFVYN